MRRGAHAVPLRKREIEDRILAHRVAEDVRVNRIVRNRLLHKCHFQIESARTMSENRTFAASESLSVPITIRMAQDSNWA